jgi:hypothetical protein
MIRQGVGHPPGMANTTWAVNNSDLVECVVKCLGCDEWETYPFPKDGRRPSNCTCGGASTMTYYTKKPGVTEGPSMKLFSD